MDSNSDQFYEQLNNAIRTIEKQNEEIASLSEQNVDLAIQLGELDSIKAAASESAQEVIRLKEEVSAHKAQIEQLRSSLADEETKARKAEQDAAEITEEKLRLQKEINDLQEQNLELQLQLEEQAKQIAELSQALAQSQASNAKRSAALADLKKVMGEVSSPAPAPESESAAKQHALRKLEALLSDRIGSAMGKKIFEKVCKSLSINADSECSAEVLRKAGLEAASPALLLCKGGSEAKQSLQKAIADLCGITNWDEEKQAAVNLSASMEIPAVSAAPASEVKADAAAADAKAAEEAKAAADAKAAEEAKAAADAKAAEEAKAAADTKAAEEAKSAEVKAGDEEEMSGIYDGCEQVISTFIPNRTLQSKLAVEFENEFNSIITGTKSKFSDPIVDLIYKTACRPDKITEKQRVLYKPNKVSGSILRSSVDPDLEAVINWLKYFVLPSQDLNVYAPTAQIGQLDHIEERNDAQAQELLDIVGILNKHIFNRKNIDIKFFKGPYVYISVSNAKKPVIYFNEKLLSRKFTAAQLSFFAAKALFAMQRSYFEVTDAVRSLFGSDFDPIEFGSTHMKRTLSSASEKSQVQFPSDLIVEVSDAWSIDTKEELCTLLDKCYEASNYAQFTYVKELLANPHPFRQSMNIEGDTFALKFSNVYDASLAIATVLIGKDEADRFASEGFVKLFSDPKYNGTYLQQRIKDLWLSYYESGDELVAF